MRFLTIMRKGLSKSRKTNNKVNKKGFTLVELLVSVAIMAVIALLVARFVASSTAAYRRISSKTKIQEACQDSLNQVSNIVRNSKELIITRGFDNTIVMESINYENKTIRLVYVPDTEENDFGRIYVDYDYVESDDDITALAPGEEYNDHLLTDLVRNFTVDYSRYNGEDESGNVIEIEQKRVLDITLTLERNGQEFSRNVKAALRNSNPEGQTTELTIKIES